MRADLTLMVVGAPKSGSTALYQYLASHPGVQAHAHREMPFFARDEEFAAGWDAALEKYASPADPAPLVAKHTMAMYERVALERIAATTPAVVVAVLRDPVRRASSHFGYARLRGWEDAATFEEGLAREPGRPVRRPRQARDLQYAGDGVYAPRVRDVLDVFPPERRRVVTTEDLRTDPARLCAELFALAGLPPHVPDTSRAHNVARAPRSARASRLLLAVQQPGSPLRSLASRVLPSRALYRLRYAVQRVNERPAPAAAVAAETAARLRERFAGPDAELADLLGRPVPWR